MLVDKRMLTSSCSLYNIIENSPTFLAHNSVFTCPNNFKFDIEIGCMVLRSYENLSKLFIICIVMLLITSYANHQ